MPTYAELLAQREQLDRQLEQALKTERSEAISTVRLLVAQFGLSAAECGLDGAGRGRGAGRRGKGAKSAKAASRGKVGAAGAPGRGGARRTAAAKVAKPRPPVPVRYRGPNGETWTGRGRTPRWLAALEQQGASRESFRLA